MWPTEVSLALVKYLIKSCPLSLEAKSTTGDSPFLTACRFGRLDYMALLVKAGVNQSVRNKAGNNAAHCILDKNPLPKDLAAAVGVLDEDLVKYLFTQRNNLGSGGLTPLHQWVSSYGTTIDKKRKVQDALDVLKLILQYSEGAEVELLNGAGVSPLHTIVTKCDSGLAKGLLKFRPKLLYRENAVGRTPAEIAHHQVVSNKFDPRGDITRPMNHNNGGITNLASKSPEKFCNDEWRQSKSNSDGADAKEMNMWATCKWYLERYPDRRRLVSLNEANDVAKRLGEQYSSTRHFSVQVRDEDDMEQKKDEEEAKDPVDFVQQQKGGKEWSAWHKIKDDADEKVEAPACPGCGHRHDD